MTPPILITGVIPIVHMQPAPSKPSMGILNMKQGEQKFTLARHSPSGDLCDVMKHFWVIHWDLTGQPPFEQEIVPNPCVNIVIEPNQTAIYGVAPNRYSQRLEGKGKVLGIKFKPGGFYPFVKQPIMQITGRSMRFEEIFQVDIRQFEQAVLSEDEDEGMIAVAETFFKSHLPLRDGNVAYLNRIIGRIQEDRSITKVDQVCEQFEVNKRKLQRLFQQYVGTTPKWVIRLYRLQNAAELIDNGIYEDILGLSADLGYYDQSHFIKDFKAIIGATPEEYMKRILR
ncbi:helix-turn-helix domain-containing protein [Paenibacillus alvei]|nr:helix-turn-helix domain-containing protein [Paenibacillus alvei]